MESDSDLTDQLSDEFVPQTAKKTQAGGYRIKNALKPPHTSTYSADTIYRWINDGKVKLEPEYQRQIVWPDNKQTKLIDSMLRNFYVPPVIFNRITEDDGETFRVCIDGKQRLTSIKRFMDGAIPHVDSDTKKKYWYKNAGGAKNRLILPEAMKDAMRDKQIVCIEYDDLKDSHEREIFQRVQMGMPLRPAERMMAIAGPWAKYSNDIKDRYLKRKEDDDDDEEEEDEAACLLNFIDLNTSRSGDFLLIAQAIYGIDHLPGRATFSSTDVEKWLGRVDPLTAGFKAKVDAVFKMWLQVIKPWEKQRMSPVEFVMICLLIANHIDEPVDKIQSNVLKFRKNMKAQHKDLRLNSRVIKAAYELIEQTPKGKRKQADYDDDDDYRSPIAKQGRTASMRQPAANGPRTSSQSHSNSPSSSRTLVSPVKRQDSSTTHTPSKSTLGVNSSAGAGPDSEARSTMDYLKDMLNQRAAGAGPGSNVAPPVSVQHSGPLGSPAGNFNGALGQFFGSARPSLQGQSAQPQPYGMPSPTTDIKPPGIQHPQQGQDARHLPGYRPPR